jgi:hypothetical protein
VGKIIVYSWLGLVNAPLYITAAVMAAIGEAWLYNAIMAAIFFQYAVIPILVLLASGSAMARIRNVVSDSPKKVVLL